MWASLQFSLDCLKAHRVGSNNNQVDEDIHKSRLAILKLDTSFIHFNISVCLGKICKSWNLILHVVQLEYPSICLHHWNSTRTFKLCVCNIQNPSNPYSLWSSPLDRMYSFTRNHLDYSKFVWLVWKKKSSFSWFLLLLTHSYLSEQPEFPSSILEVSCHFWSRSTV